MCVYVRTYIYTSNRALVNFKDFNRYLKIYKNSLNKRIFCIYHNFRHQNFVK